MRPRLYPRGRRRRRRALAGLAALLAVAMIAGGTWALASHEGAYEPSRLYPRGGVGGGDAWVIPLGDIQGLRNIQGGRHTTDPGDLNLDIGAGSSEHRGVVAINFDVGRALVIYDGHGQKLASFSRRHGVVFYRRPTIRR